MITSGSARTSERSAWAKVSPMAGLISIWTMPVILRSTGSSTVYTLRSADRVSSSVV